LTDAQSQVVQLPRSLVQNAQSQARRKDLVVHHLIAHQLKGQGIEVTADRHSRRAHGFFKPSRNRIHPNRFTLLKRYPSITPILRFFGIGTFV
jgi:hypothetical protein